MTGGANNTAADELTAEEKARARRKQEIQEERDQKAFDTSAQMVTISPEVFARLPEEIRDWNTEDVLLWLSDLFRGAADYPR